MESKISKTIPLSNDPSSSKRVNSAVSSVSGNLMTMASFAILVMTYSGLLDFSSASRDIPSLCPQSILKGEQASDFFFG